MEDEAITRLNKTPKGTNIKGEAATDSIPEITYLEEGLYNLGYYISIEDVDSIASTLLLEHKISSDFILNLINPKTGKVLQQSKKETFVYGMPFTLRKFLSAQTYHKLYK